MKHFKAYSGTFYYAAVAMGQGDRYREEVKGIDPTAFFVTGTPGRINCGPLEYLCTGSSHQLDFMHTLESLAKLPYVQRIDAIDFE